MGNGLDEDRDTGPVRVDLRRSGSIPAAGEILDVRLRCMDAADMRLREDRRSCAKGARHTLSPFLIIEGVSSGDVGNGGRNYWVGGAVAPRQYESFVSGAPGSWRLVPQMV